LNANVEFEKLALEVSAIRAGLTPVSPHVLQGDSGVEHRFDLLFSDGNRNYGFDFYEKVTEIEVLRSYAKMLDTRMSVNIVCPGPVVTESARELASFYDIEILSPANAESFFVAERPQPRRTFG